MKPTLLVAVAGGALGVWAGFNSWQSDTATTTFYAGLSVLIGGNLLLCSWAWWKATPGSGDAMVMPTLVLLSSGILVGILPRLFWPSSDGAHVVGSLVSAAIVISTAIVQFRKRRRLRDKARPV